MANGLGSTTLPFQNVKLSLKLKFMQILVPPHRAHKLCKPSWGKETIKYKPWDIYLHYCCHVLKSKIHFCAIENLYKMYNNHKRGSCLLQKVDFKKCRKNTSRKR